LGLLLRQHAPTWLVQIPWLLTPADREHLQQELQGTTRERMLREFAGMIETLTAETPLVLVLEDLHWSDHATLDMVTFLARRRDPAQLLLLGTFRPVETIVHGHPLRPVVQTLQRDGHASTLPLDPLPVEAVTAYLSARFPGHRLPATLAVWLHAYTDGNPLFLVTTLSALVERGVLAEHGGHWGLQQPLDTVAFAVPEGVRLLLDQQLERLPAELLQVLEVASVAGVAFDAAVVAAGLEAPASQVDTHCEALVRYDLVQPGGLSHWPDGTVTTRYTFTHALYQQTAYERLGAGRRVQLHQRLGSRLEGAFGPQAPAIAATLAEHFVRGHEHPRAVRYGWLAAATALSRHAHREGITHLSRMLDALTWLPESSERTQQELQALVTLGRSLMATQGAAAQVVAQTYARAYTLCQHMEDTASLLPVLAGLQRFYMVRADYPRAYDLAARLLAMAQRLHNQEFVCEGHTILGVVQSKMGHLTAAHTHQEQAHAVVVPQPLHRRGLLQDVQVANLVNGARVLWCLGYPAQAWRWSQEGLMRARALVEPTSLTFALLQGAHLQLYRRDAAAVKAMAEEVLGLTEAQEFTFWRAWSYMFQGWSVVMQGSPAAGIAVMRQGIAALEAMGARIDQPVFLSMLAEGYGAAADPAAGLEVLADALALVHDLGERLWEAELYRLRGELLLHARSTPLQAISQAQPAIARVDSQPEAWFQRALDIARQQQAKSWELRAATSLARLWQQQGQRAEACELLAPIYGWFTEGFDTADLQEAKALLAELEG
jgi:predicted ATPase